MNLSAYIIDDEFHAIDILSDYIRRTPGLELIGSATDPLQGLAALNTDSMPHLLFLDIHMPGLVVRSLPG